jgi:hypothetical protein
LDLLSAKDMALRIFSQIGTQGLSVVRLSG